MQQVDPDLLSCVDYLFASSDYLDFIGLMLDFKVRFRQTKLAGSRHVAVIVIKTLKLIIFVHLLFTCDSFVQGRRLQARMLVYKCHPHLQGVGCVMSCAAHQVK